MRILGIDYGSRRLGLATSDLLGITAQPLQTLDRDNNEITRLREIIEEYEVSRIVIGLPMNMDGSEAVHYQDVLEYIKILEKELGLPVETWDERLTTAQAERILLAADTSRKKRKKVIDKMAASIILQAYMDANPGIVGS